MSKKLVEREHLQYIAQELHSIKLQTPSPLYERIDELLKFIEGSIIQSNQDSKNEFKRVIYKRMKEAQTPEENRKWYEFYKSLDDTFSA